MDPSAPQSSAPPPVERRIQAKLPAGESIVAWGRAWVSRDGRFAAVVAARTLDFAVLTDDHLYLYSTGFFSRRPRRRVYAMSLDRLYVEDCGAKRGARLRVRAEEHRPLLLEFRESPRNWAFGNELLARTQEPSGEPPRGPDGGDAA
jgi:hypothetical protein